MTVSPIRFTAPILLTLIGGSIIYFRSNKNLKTRLPPISLSKSFGFENEPKDVLHNTDYYNKSPFSTSSKIVDLFNLSPQQVETVLIEKGVNITFFEFIPKRTLNIFENPFLFNVITKIYHFKRNQLSNEELKKYEKEDNILINHSPLQKSLDDSANLLTKEMIKDCVQCENSIISEIVCPDCGYILSAFQHSPFFREIHQLCLKHHNTITTYGILNWRHGRKKTPPKVIVYADDKT